jgi:hypothetical protein
MSNRKSKTVSSGTFEQIEAAVRETERGRWFLDEYARRHAKPDTLELLGSLRRIERALATHSSTGPGPDMLSLTQRIIEARKALPEIAEQGGRIAAETLMATEVLDGLGTLAPEILGTSGSRMVLTAETARLKDMAGEQRNVYARLEDCAARFKALEAELLSSLVPSSAKDETPAPTTNLQYFTEDEDLFVPTATRLAAAPAPESHLKLVSSTEPEAESAPEIEQPPVALPDTPAFTATEKRRIVILRGNAQPPVPEADEAPAITA